MESSTVSTQSNPPDLREELKTLSLQGEISPTWGLIKERLERSGGGKAPATKEICLLQLSALRLLIRGAPFLEVQETLQRSSREGIPIALEAVFKDVIYIDVAGSEAFNQVRKLAVRLLSKEEVEALARDEVIRARRYGDVGPVESAWVDLSVLKPIPSVCQVYRAGDVKKLRTLRKGLGSSFFPLLNQGRVVEAARILGQLGSENLPELHAQVKLVQMVLNDAMRHLSSWSERQEVVKELFPYRAVFDSISKKTLCDLCRKARMYEEAVDLGKELLTEKAFYTSAVMIIAYSYNHIGLRDPSKAEDARNAILKLFAEYKIGSANAAYFRYRCFLVYSGLCVPETEEARDTISYLTHYAKNSPHFARIRDATAAIRLLTDSEYRAKQRFLFGANAEVGERDKDGVVMLDTEIQSTLDLQE